MSLEELDELELLKLTFPLLTSSKQRWTPSVIKEFLGLVYVVNRISPNPLRTEIRVAADISNAGSVLTVPANRRWELFMGRIIYTATATLGTRAVELRVRDKPTNTIFHILNDGPTASQVRSYDFGPFNTGPATVVRQITFPIPLEPEWNIFIDDTSNIDPADDVAWVITLREERV